MRRRSAVRLVCVLLFSGLITSAAFAGDPQWVEVRSPHFSVVTDAGEKRGRDVALRFEQMRAAFGGFMNKAKVSVPIPLQIVAFRNTKEMRQYVPLWKGKPVELSGLFQGDSDRSYILLDMSTYDPWHAVFHEYAHQLLNGNIEGETPPWFDEGFAEFFSTIEASGKIATLGKWSLEDSAVLDRYSMMPVAMLFQVQHNSSVYNESGDHRSVFYAQSWLMVHYLYDQKWIQKLGDYMTLTDRGVPVEAAIQQAYGMSAADLDRTLKNYFQTGRFRYYTIPMPETVEASGYINRPLSATDTKAILADVHLRSPDYKDQAVTEFEEVLKQEPDNALALRGLGYAYLRKHDYQQAGEYFAKAVAKDSTDAKALYYSATLAQQQEGKALRDDPARLEKAQQQLEKSIQLDPEFPDAYSTLGYLYMIGEKLDKAAETLKKAMAMNPRNDSYALNLAQIYVADHKFDAAIPVLEKLTRSADPFVSSQAASVLSSARHMKEVAARGGNVQFSIGGGPAKVVEVPDNPEPVKSAAPAKYVTGKLVSADCSSPPSAVLTVVAGAKTFKLQTKDSTHMILIGADKFSCEWTNRKVAVNYRESGAVGDIISLEVQ